MKKLKVFINIFLSLVFIAILHCINTSGGDTSVSTKALASTVEIKNDASRYGNTLDFQDKKEDNSTSHNSYFYEFLNSNTFEISSSNLNPKNTSDYYYNITETGSEFTYEYYTHNSILIFNLSDNEYKKALELKEPSGIVTCDEYWENYNKFYLSISNTSYKFSTAFAYGLLEPIALDTFNKTVGFKINIEKIIEREGVFYQLEIYYIDEATNNSEHIFFKPYQIYSDYDLTSSEKTFNYYGKINFHYDNTYFPEKNNVLKIEKEIKYDLKELYANISDNEKNFSDNVKQLFNPIIIDKTVPKITLNSENNLYYYEELDTVFSKYTEDGINITFSDNFSYEYEITNTKTSNTIANGSKEYSELNWDSNCYIKENIKDPGEYKIIIKDKSGYSTALNIYIYSADYTNTIQYIDSNITCEFDDNSKTNPFVLSNDEELTIKPKEKTKFYLIDLETNNIIKEEENNFNINNKEIKDGSYAIYSLNYLNEKSCIYILIDRTAPIFELANEEGNILQGDGSSTNPYQVINKSNFQILFKDPNGEYIREENYKVFINGEELKNTFYFDKEKQLTNTYESETILKNDLRQFYEIKDLQYVLNYQPYIHDNYSSSDFTIGNTCYGVYITKKNGSTQKVIFPTKSAAEEYIIQLINERIGIQETSSNNNYSYYKEGENNIYVIDQYKNISDKKYFYVKTLEGSLQNEDDDTIDSSLFNEDDDGYIHIGTQVNAIKFTWNDNTATAILQYLSPNASSWNEQEYENGTYLYDDGTYIIRLSDSIGNTYEVKFIYDTKNETENYNRFIEGQYGWINTWYNTYDNRINSQYYSFGNLENAKDYARNREFDKYCIQITYQNQTEIVIDNTQYGLTGVVCYDGSNLVFGSTYYCYATSTGQLILFTNLNNENGFYWYINNFVINKTISTSNYSIGIKGIASDNEIYLKDTETDLIKFYISKDDSNASLKLQNNVITKYKILGTNNYITIDNNFTLEANKTYIISETDFAGNIIEYMIICQNSFEIKINKAEDGTGGYSNIIAKTENGKEYYSRDTILISNSDNNAAIQYPATILNPLIVIQNQLDGSIMYISDLTYEITTPGIYTITIYDETYHPATYNSNGYYNFQKITLYHFNSIDDLYHIFNVTKVEDKHIITGENGYEFEEIKSYTITIDDSSVKNIIGIKNIVEVLVNDEKISISNETGEYTIIINSTSSIYIKDCFGTSYIYETLTIVQEKPIGYLFVSTTEDVEVASGTVDEGIYKGNTTNCKIYFTWNSKSNFVCKYKYSTNDGSDFDEITALNYNSSESNRTYFSKEGTYMFILINGDKESYYYYKIDKTSPDYEIKYYDEYGNNLSPDLTVVNSNTYSIRIYIKEADTSFYTYLENSNGSISTKTYQYKVDLTGKKYYELLAADLKEKNNYYYLEDTANDGLSISKSGNISNINIIKDTTGIEVIIKSGSRIISNNSKTNGHFKFTWTETPLKVSLSSSAITNEEYENGTYLTADGIYILTIVDKNFNELKYTITIDSSIPILNLYSYNNDVTTSLIDDISYINIPFFCEWDDASISITKDGQLLNEIINPGDLIIEDGTYVITLTNEAGTAIKKTVVISTAKPTLSFTNLNENYYSNKNVKISWNDNSYQIYLNGFLITTSSNYFTLEDEKAYEILVIDKFLNENLYTVVIDKTAPIITLEELDELNNPINELENGCIIANNIKYSVDSSEYTIIQNGIIISGKYYFDKQEQLTGQYLDPDNLIKDLKNLYSIRYFTYLQSDENTSIPKEDGIKNGDKVYELTQTINNQTIVLKYFSSINNLNTYLDSLINDRISTKILSANSKILTVSGIYEIEVYDLANNLTTITCTIHRDLPEGEFYNTSNEKITSSIINYNAKFIWNDKSITAKLSYENENGELIEQDYYSGEILKNSYKYQIILTSISGITNIYTIEIDKNGPKIVFLGANKNLYSNSPVKVSVDEKTAYLKVNGEDYNGELLTEENIYYVECMDLAGNISYETLVIDKTPATATIVGLKNGIYTNTAIEIVPNEKNLRIYVNNQLYEIGTKIKADGNYIIHIYDLADNVTIYKASISTKIPTIEPSVPDSITNQDVIISWNEEYSVKLNDEIIEPLIKINELDETIYYLEFNVDSTNKLVFEDKYTNILEYEFKIDKTNPTIIIENAKANQKYNKSVELLITDNSKYKIYLNGKEYNSNIISKEGSHEVLVIDEASNESILSFEIKKSFNEELVKGYKTEDGIYFDFDSTINAKLSYENENGELIEQDYYSGTLIKEAEKYEIVFTDEYGNKTIEKFSIEAEKIKTYQFNNVMTVIFSVSTVLVISFFIINSVKKRLKQNIFK